MTVTRVSSPHINVSVNIIGGCGHVGLPLALALSSKGHPVCIYDINQAAIDSVRGGHMPFVERGGAALLLQVLEQKTLKLTADAASISHCDVAVLIIGTPVDEHLNPKFNVIKSTLDQLFEHFRDGQLLVLRSTVYPGTSEKVQEYFDRRKKRVSVAFCPERIAEGAAIEELQTLPQIVSGFSPEAVARARALFSCLTGDIIELLPLEAELSKLFTNAFRYIKFAISNQFFQIANDYGLDFYRIHHAMTYKYPRAQDLPTAGFAAGPCLFKDTMQLAAFNNNNFFLGHIAMVVNEGLPNYIVQRLSRTLPLHEARIGILGMAFKANSDDKRESLSYKLKKILEIEAKEVICSDVYIHERGFVSADALVERADVVILGAPHGEYRDLDLRGKRMVDVWNFYGQGGAIG